MKAERKGGRGGRERERERESRWEGESVAVSRVKLAPHSISPEGVSKPSPFLLPSFAPDAG